MLLELLADYGFFLLKIVTLVVAILAVIAFIVASKKKAGGKIGALSVVNLGKQYKKQKESLENSFLSDQARVAKIKAKLKLDKQEAKEEKARLKAGTEDDKPSKARLFVLTFKGDVKASKAESLAQEVNAVLAVARPEVDEVLVRLESGGGLVTSYGYASSQLARLKAKGIKLTVAVDKVAASGGYMMACVADKIVAAPFAILGSIGVVATLPNIHRLLKKNDVDVEVLTAGQYKRTLTVLGENTEEGREKFKEQLEQTHVLFKDFVQQNRPVVDLDKVATGEYWYGTQALELNLCDELATSDDLILASLDDKEVLALEFKPKKSLIKKLGEQAEESSENFFTRILHKKGQDFL
ncbi:protease SohB [Psittacicella hinzii]|uniref:Protease SohB n=1 Tax=Psittacicella hinzii TaxID=2028575 RepID=A0A3A1Y0S6_9GAMM|nr:protease SohB [Psittacicella hinzii]RIY31050.1 protease SohB [Psittacicella hinzii]